jgi:tRNA-uridine 2-sulfurtransferase
VDSAVAALKLVEEGRTLETATVRLWPGTDRRSCCSPGALQRAKATAAWLGVPHHLVDREAAFEGTVVEPFVRSYLSGETPNPCVLCNPMRLAALVAVADDLGLARVATGHYARLVWRDGEPYVARGADRAKDQAYMLWAVPPEVLARLEFPLGASTKAATRTAAGAAGLPTAGEPESQEVCFAVEGYRPFLEERGVAAEPGDVVDEAGHTLGRHEGHWRYTVGQRRGLGVPGGPWYVLGVDAVRNRVVVGPQSRLGRREVVLRGVVDRGLEGPGELQVQLRYRSPAVPVEALQPAGAGGRRLRLREPFDGVAPGQSAVFFRDDVVVGGGFITEAV